MHLNHTHTYMLSARMHADSMRPQAAKEAKEKVKHRKWEAWSPRRESPDVQGWVNTVVTLRRTAAYLEGLRPVDAICARTSPLFTLLPSVSSTLGCQPLSHSQLFLPRLPPPPLLHRSCVAEKRRRKKVSHTVSLCYFSHAFFCTLYLDCLVLLFKSKVQWMWMQILLIWLFFKSFLRIETSKQVDLWEIFLRCYWQTCFLSPFFYASVFFPSTSSSSLSLPPTMRHPIYSLPFMNHLPSF